MRTIFGVPYLAATLMLAWPTATAHADAQPTDKADKRSERGGPCLALPVFGVAEVVRVYVQGARCTTAREVYRAWLGGSKTEPLPGWACRTDGVKGTDQVDRVRCVNGSAAVRAVYSAAAPPRIARIVEGTGMAGSRVGQKAPPRLGGSYPGGRPFELWGAFSGNLGSCYEQSCVWDIPGGGKVVVQFDGRLRKATTFISSGPGWRTSRGIGPGVKLSKLKRRYPKAKRITSCAISPFGAMLTGYILRKPTRHRWTFFESKAKRVAQVWVGHGGARSGC